MRPGHHRPVGTIARRWFPIPLEAELGDLAVEVRPDGGGADEIRRSYLVVGIEEGRTRVTLLLERVEWGTLPDPPSPDRIWPFYRVA